MTIKILHVIKSLGRGGAEMLLPETLRLHQRDKFDFHYVYFLPWKNQMVKNIQEAGGKVVCLRATNNLHIMTKVWALAEYVREEKIQLIHAHLPWAGILARVVGKICGVPVIYTEHNKQERYHVVTRIMNLWTMDLLKLVIAVSADVADSIHKHKPRLKAPLRTIFNGVNIEQFDRQRFDGGSVRQKLNIPTKAPVIGTIAVFRFQKRLDLWMDLAGEILQKYKDAHFVIVGDGPLRADLIKKRRSLGLEGRIHMPGLETEVRTYLASFDIYMMSSVFEGLPVALLEAMSMQCPVIATDAGGIKEIIRHEIDGLVCPVDQADQLVEFACTLLQDPELRLKYGDSGRERVIEEFSLEKMVPLLEEIYLQLHEGAKSSIG